MVPEGNGSQTAALLAALLGPVFIHVVTLCHAARGPFVLRHMEVSMLCDSGCQGRIAAACSLNHFLGSLACPFATKPVFALLGSCMTFLP